MVSCMFWMVLNNSHSLFPPIAKVLTGFNITMPVEISHAAAFICPALGSSGRLRQMGLCGPPYSSCKSPVSQKENMDIFLQPVFRIHTVSLFLFLNHTCQGSTPPLNHTLSSAQLQDEGRGLAPCHRHVKRLSCRGSWALRKTKHVVKTLLRLENKIC